VERDIVKEPLLHVNNFQYNSIKRPYNLSLSVETGDINVNTKLLFKDILAATVFVTPFYLNCGTATAITILFIYLFII